MMEKRNLLEDGRTPDMAVQDKADELEKEARDLFSAGEDSDEKPE